MEKKVFIVLLVFFLSFCSIALSESDEKVRENEIKEMESRRGSIPNMEGEAKHAVELGWQYFDKGDLMTALTRFNQALLLDKNFAPAYFGIAYVYSVQNELDLAIENYKKSIDLDPTYSHSYSNLGLALVYSNRLEEAAPYLKKAIAIDPRNGDAQVNIAVYFFATQNYPKAWEHVHTAQSLGAKVDDAFLKDLSSEYPDPK